MNARIRLTIAYRSSRYPDKATPFPVAVRLEQCCLQIQALGSNSHVPYGHHAGITSHSNSGGERGLEDINEWHLLDLEGVVKSIA